MVKKFSMVSAVAAMLTGSALLVAQAQETPPPAQPNQQENAGAEENQQDAEEAEEQEAEQERTEAERERREQQRQAEQRREEQQRQQRDQVQQRDAAQERQDRQADQARDPAQQGRRGPELDRPGIDRRQSGQPGAAAGQRPFDRGPDGRQQFDRQQPGQFQGRGQIEGRGQFEGRDARGQQGQRQNLGLNVESTEQGQLTVQSIEQGSPAARIGLQEGDRIVSVDGRTFQSGDQFTQFLTQQRGQRVPIVIERDGRRETVFWTAEQRFGPMPPDRRFAQDQFGPQGFAQGQRRGQMHGQQQGVRPALGVHLDPHAPVVVVSKVAPGSPAEQAGIQPGDQIVALNGQELRHYSELVNRAAQLPLEQPATLAIVSRGDQQPQPVQVDPEPWHVVFQDSGMGQQQFGQPGQPQFGQQQSGQQQFGWNQQQFGAPPQHGQPWQSQQQFGARGQMGFEQQGQFEMRQPMGQPYGVARPPLNGMQQQSGNVQQEIDELHREIDSLREQVQHLRQQVESNRGAAPGRPGIEGNNRPEPPRGPQQQNVPQREREI